MIPGSALKFRSWIRRRRARIAALLVLAVLFNTAPVFAASVSSLAESGSHAMMAGHVHHDMNNMPCCDTGNDTGCACTAHCALLFLSQAVPVLHTMNNSTHLVMAQQTPVPYVDSPPLRPPRA